MSNVYVQRNLMESERYFPARGLHPQSAQGASAVTDTSPPLNGKAKRRKKGSFSAEEFIVSKFNLFHSCCKHEAIKLRSMPATMGS